MIILIRKRVILFSALFCCFVAGLAAVFWFGHTPAAPVFAARDGVPVTVVVDAGHGGEDGGTVEQAATEKEINLAVVLKLKELLEEQGIRVVLTRDKDIFMKLEERVQIANGEKADLFISIHCNYYEKDSSIYGLECYYCKSGEEGKHYAEKIMETIEESKNIVSKNVKPADYYILKNTTVPAVLVEIGYLSNYNERNQLMSEEYQEKLAGELVKGIVKGMEEKTG